MEGSREDIKFKILVVDDEPALRAINADIVEQEGYEPLEAENGVAALELIERWHHELVLIISDLKMPEMDGITLREKTLPKYQNIPFAVISAFINKDLALRAVENKICHFIDKPFNPDDVAKLIQKEANPRAEELRDDLELLYGFLDEAAHMMEELEELIVTLQDIPGDIETLNRIFGILHTIKGTSAFFSPDYVNQFSHKFEDFLSLFKNGNLVVNPDVVAIFLSAYDTLSVLIEGLKNPHDVANFNLEESLKIFDYSPNSEDDTSEPDTSVDEGASTSTNLNQKKQDSTKDWVKTPLELLDQFMRLSGEITVIRNMVNKVVQNLERKYVGDENVKTLSELLEEMHLINSFLQADVMELRKVSLKDVVRPISRSVRELCRSLKKDVELQIIGDDLYVDTAISEILSSSLIHMIRNCMDHGIESSAEREAAGKPASGTICLNAYQEQDEVKFEIKDDGRGIDAAKISEKLLEKELYTEDQIAKMSKEQIFETIFESGFSTAEQVTDVSGRGVGMDQVKSSVEKIFGRISVQSEISKGTQITLHLPVPKSVQIITSLTVEACGQPFSIPRDHVERVLQLDEEGRTQSVSMLEGKLVLKYDDNSLVPILDIREVFQEEETSSVPETTSIVVIRTKKSFFGLLVDAIGDSEETVVKPIQKMLKGDGIFSSATFQGDGQPGLILDVDGVAEKYGISGRNHIDQSLRDRSSNNFLAQGKEEALDYVIFKGNEGRKYALPLCFVYRLEHFSEEDLHLASGIPVMRYREKIIPVFDLNKYIVNKPKLDVVEKKSKDDKFHALVVRSFDQFFAFRVEEILETYSTEQSIDSKVRSQENLLGNILIDGELCPVVDIWKIIGEHSRQNKTTTKKTPRRSSCAPILYAEDVDFYRNYIVKGLKEAGYKVVSVNDGQRALEKLEVEKNPFSLILTDVNMPECDGLELATKVKNKKDLESLPIVALTAHTGKEEQKQMRHIGFSAILPKLGVESVINEIDQILAV